MKTFFSINIDFLPTTQHLGVDLYVNSSSTGRAHFVRVFPEDDRLTNDFRELLKSKYPRLYVSEDQRSKYLDIISNQPELSEVQKAAIVKDSAVKYLADICEAESDEGIAQAISHARDAVDSMVNVIEDQSVGHVQDLIAALSFHDFYTYDHSINVCMYSISILKGIIPNASRSDLVLMGMGGLLHDIGKLHVQTKIINKPSKLTDEEFEQIKAHPLEGEKLINKLRDQLPKDVPWDFILQVVTEHHENFDGTGYPFRKGENEIAPLAKICTFADIYDAITTKRSYNDVLDSEKALEVMASLSGRKLDPELLKRFLEHMKVYIPSGKRNQVIKGNFDPSVPFSELEIIKLPSEIQKEKEDFGKIITKNYDDRPDEEEKEDLGSSQKDPLKKNPEDGRAA